MPLPPDYADRVYAGVLGKLIGVYLGRPIEGWSYDRITAEHGEVDRYLADSRGAPLVVTDDDISGTFTFLRSLPDHGNDPALTPRQIGETWLNYLIERRTILWWGGIGNSTEHTAYVRLKQGVSAPKSGSIALNGQTLAEQIGSQIFIDGWAMICPGDPERAADFARRAASVSHDGEAIFGAQVVAAMEAQAFVESDLNRLLDTAVGLIPANSIIARLIADIREWHAAEPDWRKARELIAGRYGYDKYGGNCHMVPNHALIIHALLYGDDDFRRSLMIVNTSGWDTDCNAGNVGCLLGIKNGLAPIDDSPVDWRGPVADRLYLATADGGRAISDAAIESLHVVNIGRALADEPPLAPKGGARFHFAFPGSVQGFQAADPTKTGVSRASGGEAGEGRLAITLRPGAAGATQRVATPTFIPPEAIAMPGYELLASPTLYPGQTVRAVVGTAVGNSAPLECRLFVQVYGDRDLLTLIPGPGRVVTPGGRADLVWLIPDTGGAPIAEIGIEVVAIGGEATAYLDSLTWDGAPDLTLGRPKVSGELWRRAWVNGVDQFEGRWPEPYRIVKNEGTGLISQGTADWVDYRAEATITVYLAQAAGLAVRVGGLRRWYALLLGDDSVARLVKARDGETTLAEAPFARQLDRPYALTLEATGTTPHLRAWIDGAVLFDLTDDGDPLPSGGVGLVVREGCLGSEAVRISPIAPPST